MVDSFKNVGVTTIAPVLHHGIFSFMNFCKAFNRASISIISADWFKDSFLFSEIKERKNGLAKCKMQRRVVKGTNYQNELTLKRSELSSRMFRNVFGCTRITKSNVKDNKSKSKSISYFSVEVKGKVFQHLQKFLKSYDPYQSLRKTECLEGNLTDQRCYFHRVQRIKFYKLGWISRPL